MLLPNERMNFVNRPANIFSGKKMPPDQIMGEVSAEKAHEDNLAVLKRGARTIAVQESESAPPAKNKYVNASALI